MERHQRQEPHDDTSYFDTGVDKRLNLIDNLTRIEFDKAGKIIDHKLQAAMASLEHSTAALQMLLSSQSPAELDSVEGQALRNDLETLLASSTHLARLAAVMQQDFHNGRLECERRTEQKIADVVEAIACHRTAVQDNAIALTEAALSKARAPLPPPRTGRGDDRRAR